MSELASLKKQRSANKGRLTMVLNFIKGAKEDVSVDDFRARLARVETLMSEYTIIENKIFSLDPEEEPDYVYEENYYNAITNLNKRIRERTIGTGNLLADASLNTTQTDHVHEIKLPKINIPPFSGEYTEWQPFFDLFASTIHDSASLSAVQKFQYLKGLLRGEAAVLLKHISITESNYIGALNKLKERYDRKIHIINSFIRTFVEQPSISTANASNIRRLMDTSDEVIRGLKALGENAEKRDHWLIFLLVQKLDDKSKMMWAEAIAKSETPQFSTFIEFLSRRIDALESANVCLKKPVAAKYNVKSYIATGEPSFNCAICNGHDHSLFFCKDFNEMDVNQRRDWANSNHRCFNCLSSRHLIHRCTSKRSCLHCKKRHHTLLHLSEGIENTSANSETPANTEELTSHHAQNTSVYSLLPTALIEVLDSFGNLSSCRALLDSGSQASFITESCVQRLGLKKRNSRLSVIGLGGYSAGSTKGLVTIFIRPKYHPEFSINAFILSKLTTNLPHQNIKNLSPDKLPQLQLADPYFHRPGYIDILIGADYFFNLLEEGQMRVSTDGPILHKTILGWVVSGKVNNFCDGDVVSMVATTNDTDVDLDRALYKFWELESIPNFEIKLSPEESLCEIEFAAKTTISSDGRFTVSLPFKRSAQDLGNSVNTAIQRLRSMERRFAHDADFKKLYHDFILEYQSLNHMQEIPRDEVNSTGYYLPHHGVLKHSSSTTKLRVVFDGSAKTTSGISLNDCLAVGPTVQASLHAIILRFREHKFVVTADVEKMYRQVKVDSKDTNLQRIVWRNHPSEPIRHFRLNTVTYGLASSAFLATRVLKKIADDNQALYPIAAQAISLNIYVDDLMTGASTEAETMQLKHSINKILSQHGFNLRKWMSNSTSILKTLESETKPEIKTIQEDRQSDSIKILGLKWNPAKDQFTFTSELTATETFTKRIVVSEASRLFDPLGWLAPVIIQIKIFIQKLWAINLDWDQLLPEEASRRWQVIRGKLEGVNQISIPRFLEVTKFDTIEIHGFADSSEDAFAAVVYLRIQAPTGKTFVKLLSAKTKVAPIKQVSLPRLELCAAVLLTKLIKVIRGETQLVISGTYAWSDSRIVLDWLASHPRRWSTFVGNRTSEILTTLPRKHWRHVASADNPADCASRGLSPQDLKIHQLWWNGPLWLHQSDKYWPPQQNDYGSMEEVNNKIFTFNITTASTCPWLDELISKYSSITKIQRIFAYVLRFIANSKAKAHSRTRGTYLMREELFRAMYKLCQYEQYQFFQNEIIQLQTTGEINNCSKLKPLSPYLDASGLMRVGGRLENSEAPFSTKHPIIIHPKSSLTKLILEDTHRTNKHAGPSLTLAITKQNFWIPSGRNTVRQIINKCVICAKFKAHINNQIMGNLPSCRVEFIRPFLAVGVDYAGPVPIHLRKGRGQRTYKSYICLFICLSTKAIHLELVCDMTSESFLGALKRFVARRGICQEIHSDNGTNFVGANNQLRQNFNKIISDSQMISDYSSRYYISWHFNPPSAPHFGGIWEAGIKSAKFHLKRVIGNTVLTIEEMGTLLCEVESTLNSRPICALNSTDIDVLTPSHFLIGHPATKIPELDITHLKTSYLTRWQMIQQLSQHFWKRWHVEYLTSLQPKAKWRDAQAQIRIDDIVIIKEENTAVNQWPLGRVIKLHPGLDGITRVVTLRTKSGEMKRPTSKLVILPISNQDDSNVNQNYPSSTGHSNKPNSVITHSHISTVPNY